ncbi:hypothetical protein [Haematobacter massiliensis]|nr:hypothetical protein [Haematobacter massiliensis]OWJ84695.1 hypothetical protein CDV51_13545 [Haematobacter massiliensis]QBJ26340.1 hypothetical protein HmaOT1_18525 [Haematobacter massiliensis]
MSRFTVVLNAEKQARPILAQIATVLAPPPRNARRSARGSAPSDWPLLEAEVSAQTVRHRHRTDGVLMAHFAMGSLPAKRVWIENASARPAPPRWLGNGTAASSQCRGALRTLCPA